MATLVTGASGFVGLNLVELLLRLDTAPVVALSLDPIPAIARKVFAALPGRLNMVLGDLNDPGLLRRVMSQYEVERVFHGAALTAAGERERNQPARVIDVNLKGTLVALEAFRLSAAKRFVFASSSSVYGEAFYGAQPVDESTPAAPQSLYGITKYAAERLCLRYKTLYDRDIVCGRVAAVFGPWERDTGLRDTLSPPFQLAGLAVHGGAAVIAEGGARDWVYSRDVAAAFASLLFARDCQAEVYNIGSGAMWHLGQLCDKLKRRFPNFKFRISANAETTLAYNADLSRPRQPMDAARVVKEFRLPFHGVDDALDDYVAWVAGHAAYFDAPR